MKLKTPSKKDLELILDKKLLRSVEQKKEYIFIITEDSAPKTDPLVELEVSFQRCLRIGALRK